MKNNILYILGLCLLLAGTVSCREEMETAGTAQTDNSTVLVELPYSETVQASRSVATGYAIQTLDVLAFDNNGKYLYTSQSKPLYTTDNGKSYLYTLAIEQKESHTQQSFVFIANMHDVLASIIASATSGLTKETIMKQLIFQNCDWTKSQNGIPMWGETATAYDVTTAPAVLNSIKLVRAVAAIEVLVNGDLVEVHGLDNFKITDIIPRDFADKGYVAPDKENYTWENNRYTIKAPSVPDGVGTFAPYTLSATGATNSMQGMLFVPEFKTNDTKTSQTLPCVLIGGYYGKENSTKKTWYKVNLIKGEKPIDVLRNVQYVLNITAVSGEGYGSDEEAYSHPSQNMRTVLTMNYTDTQGLTNVVYDSSTFLAASHAEISVGGEAELTLMTNASGGWSISAKPDWLQVVETSGVANQKKTVKLTVSGSSEEQRSGTIEVKAGQLTLSIKVNDKANNQYTYTTATPQHFIDAATLGITASEFQLSGGVAFYGKYLYIGNSYHKIENSKFTKRPALIVYDTETKSVVCKIEEWQHGDQTLNFEGNTQWPDIIDDIVADNKDNRLYVMRRHSCVEVFDISNPESPTYVTRIGQSMISRDERYTFQNSSAVGVCDRAVLIRAANVLNTYERSTITPDHWQNIASKTSDNRNMLRLGYQPRQFAQDSVDNKLWLTEYGNNTFKGLYQLEISRMDGYSGKEYQYCDLRGIQFPLSYNPTGMAILKDKVYVLQSSGDIDIFDRSKLYPAATYGTRSHAAAEDVPRTRATIEDYNFGYMSKLYAADDTGATFWTCDTQNNKLVLVKIEIGTVEK